MPEFFRRLGHFIGSIGLGIALAAVLLAPGGDLLAADSTAAGKLTGTGGIVLMSGVLGFAALFAVRKFPSREGARTLELLRTQTLHFQSALDNMSQGLCIFDAGHGLIVWNGRFVDQLGIPPGMIALGMSEGELMALSEGTHSRDQEAAAAAGEGSILRRPSGVVISVSRHPMANGGAVVTYEDITAREWAEATIFHMVRHDALTSLPNRLLLHEALGQALSYAGASDNTAVLLLDIDNLQQINETFGYALGDELLKAVTVRLRGVVRETDIVARFGGDEFAIVQAKVTQPFHATGLASRLIEAMAAPFDLDGHRVVVGASIGIALAPAEGTDPHQLLRRAGMALCSAKAQGRGTHRYFEAAMDARLQLRRALEEDLRKAVENAEFELFYQPVVDVGTEDVSGFEALLRWNHPVRGLIEPDEFVPLAEETGLIVPIGEWAILEACREAASWPGDLKIAVNLSPAQFANPTLIAAVRGALVGSGLVPGRLELEITESVLLRDNSNTMAMLDQLRDIGVRISMDDFGTGYSSLNYLRKFRFDKIKIDRSLIEELSEHDNSVAIIRAVSAIGHSLGMLTIVEGVETREQFEWVKNEGCTHVQGYLFGAPRPAKLIPMLLAHGAREVGTAGTTTFPLAVVAMAG